MKVRAREGDHRVPLGSTIAADLRGWHDTIDDEGYVVPSPSSRPEYLGRETIEKLYSEALKLDGRHSPHAWRISLSTLARDAGEIDRDVIELLLDHMSGSQVIRAYNRARRLARRVSAGEWWDRELNAVVPQ